MVLFQLIKQDMTIFRARLPVRYEPIYSDEHASLILLIIVFWQENAKMLRLTRVYIGYCTGAKTEDFSAAAKLFLASGKKVKVPIIPCPCYSEGVDGFMYSSSSRIW
ncbi:3-isopropylmalate dehydratase large subunit, chloroplastic-like [Nicotiana tabacum]|uniref:3-isopropylmalate dehydratase large subunit, chloroplastic-like n=1 Tax=Nicotiana tabacum TaxID=4097 RepID=A0AC58SNC3_TOBAC